MNNFPSLFFDIFVCREYIFFSGKLFIYAYYIFNVHDVNFTAFMLKDYMNVNSIELYMMIHTFISTQRKKFFSGNSHVNLIPSQFFKRIFQIFTAVFLMGQCKSVPWTPRLTRIRNPPLFCPWSPLKKVRFHWTSCTVKCKAGNLDSPKMFKRNLFYHHGKCTQSSQSLSWKVKEPNQDIALQLNVWNWLLIHCKQLS